MRPALDDFMSCCCGRGDYLYCTRCPYPFCSWHGEDATADKRAALAWWRVFMLVARLP